MKEKTDEEKILARIREADRPLSLTELQIIGISESTAGARLREMTRAGLTFCEYRKGKRFKHWGLPEWSGPAQRDLPLGAVNVA